MTIDIKTLGRHQGSFLLQGLSISKTRNETDMLQGTIIVRGGDSIRFVCFDNVIVSQFKENGVTTIYVSDGDVTIQNYNESLSAKLEGIRGLSVDYNPSEFMEVIDPSKNAHEIGALVRKLMTEKGAQLTLHMLSDRGKELSVAMAAQYGGYHDGKVGGLLNHIRKLLRYAEVAMTEYELLHTMSPEERDLVILGLVVHDFGKILELKNGAYTEISIVPHTYLGIEIISKYKDLIEETYNEMFYRELQAIILEHHGEFGERPKTVYAYLVHVIDLLDSRVSGLQRKVEGLELGDTTNVAFDGYKLQFNRYDASNTGTYPTSPKQEVATPTEETTESID